MNNLVLHLENAPAGKVTDEGRLVKKETVVQLPRIIDFTLNGILVEARYPEWGIVEAVITAQVWHTWTMMELNPEAAAFLPEKHIKAANTITWRTT